MSANALPRPTLDTAVIDRASSGLLIAGILGVFQFGVMPLYWVGLGALAISVVLALVSELLQRKVWQHLVLRLAVMGMVIGTLGMLQSWNIWLYANGFTLLGWSTLTFIVVSHVPVAE
jgi:hypothetical protein